MKDILSDLVSSIGDDQAQPPLRRYLVVNAPAKTSAALDAMAAEMKRTAFPITFIEEDQNAQDQNQPNRNR
jgi:hypothetical protein